MSYLTINKKNIKEEAVFNNHDTLKNQFIINVKNNNDDDLTAIYKCSSDNDIFNRYGRFNNNFYQNSFFKNNIIIEKNKVNTLYDYPKQFDDLYNFINEFLNNTTIETFIDNNINHTINDDFFILKKGNYIINNKYNLSINDDLFFYIHTKIINSGKCKKYNLACPQLIGHEFLNYKNNLYIYNNNKLTINDVLINIFNIIRLLESLKRRKYEDYVLFLNFDDNDDEIFKNDFLNTYIKKIFKTFKISLIK